MGVSDNIWSCLKEVKPLGMYDVECGKALESMQGIWASSRGKGEVSWFFSHCSGILGYILDLGQGWPLKTGDFQ